MNSPEQTPTNQKLSVRPADLPPSQQTAESYDKTAKFPREHRDNKGETRRLSTGARIAIGMLATGVITGGTILGYAAKQTADFKSNLDDLIDEPSSSAPANPGETGPPTPEQSSEALTPIILTDAEVATLKAGDSDESRAIYDAKLIPKIQEAVDQIHENTQNDIAPLSGLDLTAVAPSNEAVSVLANIEGGSKDPIQICHTTPNVDGSLNFCTPTTATRIGIGEPIVFSYVNLGTYQGYKWDTTETKPIQAEITDDNHLIIVSDE